MSDQLVTFRLTSGSGPVHISGTHATESSMQADDDDDEDDLLEEEEEHDDDEAPGSSLNGPVREECGATSLRQ